MDVSSLGDLADAAAALAVGRTAFVGTDQKFRNFRNPPQTSSTPAAMMKKLLQPHPGHAPKDPDGP
jgi:hypothetical protein